MFPGKPQIPTPPTANIVKDWQALQRNFKTITEHGQSQTLYLQNYLGQLQQWMVPLQAVVTPVLPSQSPYSVAANDTFIGASASASAATEVDLPQAVGSGRLLIIAKLDANAHDITVKANGSDRVNGLVSTPIVSQYSVMWLIDAAVGVWLAW